MFERRHDDLLKLQRYARTVNIDKRGKKKEDEGGTILIGSESDPADEKTLKRFIHISNRTTVEELEQGLSPRSNQLHRGILIRKEKPDAGPATARLHPFTHQQV